MISNMCLVVLEGRKCNPFLEEWSEQFETRRMMRAFFPDHVACMRNQAFKWFRDECTQPWLVMCDDDIVPVDGIEEFLHTDGDIVGARALGRGGHESHQASFTMAAVKVHRRVIEAMQPPWFAFSFSQDGLQLKQCECVYFWRKALDAGFSVVRAGRVGHRFPVTVVPGDTQPSFLFDADLRRARSTQRW